MPKELTVIVLAIRPDLVERMLDTLYEYTEPIFYVYLIDQTIKGLDSTRLRDKFKNLMVIRTPKSDVHYTGNLGFAQATNLGITLVQTPYFMMCNDDVEFINSKWWWGVKQTFLNVEQATPERPAAIVNLASIRLADWSVGRKAGDDFDIIPYKEKYTDEDWEFLVNEPHYVNEHLTIEPGSVFDGVTLYASVCDTARFLEVGLLDEKYFPGSGEDYDWSCLSSMRGYRSVCTTLSWVFHHWSSTFKDLRDKEDIKSLLIPELAWNQNHEKWGKGFDIWGVKCPQCGEGMRCPKDNSSIATCPKHPEEIYKMPESTISEL
jgi:GT2 family glycosyltransferase